MGWPGPMTDRQFQAWRLWYQHDVGNPGKLELHIMRVAAEVRLSVAEKGTTVRLADFGMRLERAALTVEEEKALANEKWHSKLYTGKWADRRPS